MTSVAAAPVKCHSVYETLIYLNLSELGLLEEPCIPIYDCPTLNEITGTFGISGSIPKGFDCRGKFPYKFDVQGYIAGSVVLKDCVVPYLIQEGVSNKNGNFTVDRTGDLLWKLVVTGRNLRDVKVFLGNEVLYSQSPPCYETTSLNIEFNGGKGIPLIASVFQELTVKASSTNFTVYQYHINLRTPDRKPLVNPTEIVWPEGTFAMGVFKPAK